MTGTSDCLETRAAVTGTDAREFWSAPVAGIVFYAIEDRFRDAAGKPVSRVVVECQPVVLEREADFRCGSVILPEGARVVGVVPAPPGLEAVCGADYAREPEEFVLGFRYRGEGLMPDRYAEELESCLETKALCRKLGKE